MLINNSGATTNQNIKKQPVNQSDLLRYFNAFAWYPTVFNSQGTQGFSDKYNTYSTLGIIKSLILPFMCYIPTERALARELDERGFFQSLCDFSPGNVPSRGTIWNFRKKYVEEYSKAILKILSILAVFNDNGEINYNLPYVYISTHNDEKKLEIKKYEFVYQNQILYTESEVPYQLLKFEIWQTPPKNKKRQSNNHENLQARKIEELNRGDLDWLSWERIQNKYLDREKSWLSNDLSLPVFIKVTKIGSEDDEQKFIINAPEWLEIRSQDWDTVTGFSSTAIPYIACNILVFRYFNGKKQLLLAKRRYGFGKDTYAIPGGKALTGESMETCARRELEQETTIKIIKSKPVSIKITHFPNKPWAVSVGVLADEYSGSPQNTEKFQHDKWQWFDVNNLPAPIFEPTRIVINQYNSETFNNLEWKDLELFVEQKQQRQKQIQMPLPI